MRPFSLIDIKLFMLTKTAKAIILETVEYYKKNPRAMDNNNRGTYLTTDGRMCAVGRCLIQPTIDMIGNVRSYINPLDTILKLEYRGHSIEFWEDLQILHDHNNFWNSNCLTIKGEVFVQTLLEKY